MVANSDATREALVKRLGVPQDRVHTCYYGIDAERFRPVEPAERKQGRAILGWDDDLRRPGLAFVGALGDRRKGFDVLYQAWQILHQDRDWNGRLAVLGAGAGVELWKARALADGLGSEIQLLGFRNDVPAVLAGCDLLVSPTRYEAYGLNVHEAICRGLPAVVSKSAGVAERFEGELANLLLEDPGDPAELAQKIKLWNARRADFSAAAAELGETLRGRTWDCSIDDFVSLVENSGRPSPMAHSHLS